MNRIFSRPAFGIFLFGIIAGCIVAYALSVSRSVSMYPQPTNFSASPTGSTSSEAATPLSFENSGTVISILKKINDTVKPGEPIAKLDTAEILASITETQARKELDIQKLDVLQDELTDVQKIGSTTESTTTAQVLLMAALSDSASSTLFALVQTNPLFLNPDTSNPQLVFSVDPTIVDSIQSGQVQAVKSVADVQNVVQALATTSDVVAASAQVKQDIAEVKLFIDNISIAIDSLGSTSAISSPTIASWQINLATARSEVNSSLTSILSADNEFATAEGVGAGTTVLQSQIKTAEATVVADTATLDSYKTGLSRSVMSSGVAGIITKETLEIGQTVTANQPVVWIRASTSTLLSFRK